MNDSPEMPAPGYDAQTRPTGQPVAVNRTDVCGSAEHITVAQTPPDYAERAEYKPTSTKPTSTTQQERDAARADAERLAEALRMWYPSLQNCGCDTCNATAAALRAHEEATR